MKKIMPSDIARIMGCPIDLAKTPFLKAAINEIDNAREREQQKIIFTSTPVRGESIFQKAVQCGKTETFNKWITDMSLGIPYNKENKMHEVQIRRVNRGFIINVGCQTFVFEKDGEMFDAIREYYTDPEKAEKKYCDKGD